MDGEGATRPAAETILIGDEHQSVLLECSATLHAHFPTAVVTTVTTRDAFIRHAREGNFDLAIVPAHFQSSSTVTLLHELKLLECEPSVVVLVEREDHHELADAYAAGAHSCIIRNEGWQRALGPAVRHLLRLRKLEEENRLLLTKLTEANILLEERNKRLNEFSATLAHDIRGPLGGISMKLEYTLDQYEQTLDEKCAELLRRALKASERLTAVVQGMYDFARLGAKANRMGEVSLGALVDEVIGDLNIDASIDVKIKLGELPVVWGNDALLRRVFINLILNAIKYNDQTTREIAIYIRPSQQRRIAEFVDVVVEDNGRGIPQDEVRDLFTMFSRASSSRGDTEGSGIGLAVVQRIMELHCGQVQVESTLGKGTKFILTLPREKLQFVADSVAQR